MSAQISPYEHPVTPVALHWLHIGSLAALTYTGLEIMWAAPSAAEPAAASTHMGIMPLFLASTVLRVIWAFLGAGSAERGSYYLTDDWRHFGFGRGDAASAREWLAHYAGLKKEKPETAKYNPLQRGVYLFAFPACIIALAVTGLSMSKTWTLQFAWVTQLLGSDESVRAAHVLAMQILLTLTVLHTYAAIRDGLGRMGLMLFRFVPRSELAPCEEE